MKYKYYNGTSWVELAEKSELGSLAFLNTLDKLTTTSGYLQYSGDANTYDLHKNQKRSGGLSDLNYYYQLPSEGTLAAPVVLASRSWVMNQGYSTLVLGNTSTTAAAGNHNHDGVYAASSHTHTKSQITDFPSSMPASDVYAWAKASTKPSYTYSEVGAASAHHLYHTWDNNTDYYDSYEGGNMFRVITENMYADIFRFQASTISNLEYHNGSSWVAWSFDLSNLFDGNARTGVDIPYSNRKFRFTMRTNGGWPTTGMFMLQGTWFGDGGWPSGQKSDIIIETRANESASWTQRATFTLSGVEGMAGHTLSSLHTGETYYRITITIYPWTNTNNNCPLRRLCLFSNYNGGALEKITHDGNGNVLIPTLKATTIYENGTTLSNKYLGKTAQAADSAKLGGTAASSYVLTTDSRLSDARTPKSHAHGAISNDGAISSSYAVTSDLQGVVITNSNNYIRKVTDMPTFRSMIGAGTSNFNGYTSSNKLNSDYIQNNAGWTSVTESTVSGWGFTKNAGTVTQVKVGTTTYNPESGVISLPAYPTVNNSTITVKQTGISDQTFTLNGSATTITLVDTWRPLGTGATDACAGNDSRLSDARTPTSHTHGNISNTGTISSTAVTSATGVLVYDSNNKIQRATAAQTRSIIGAGTGTVKKVNNTSPDSNGNVSLTIPATNVIPATSTAAKLLLSTTTSGTAAWSSWSTAGYLKTGTNGTVSVDTSVVTGSSLTSNNIILGNGSSAIKASTIQLATSGTAWDNDSDTLVPTMKRIATSIGQPQQLVNGNNYFEFDGANDSTHDLKVYLAKTLNPSAPAATYYFSLPYTTGSSSANPIKLASNRDSISTPRDVQIYLHHIRIADHNSDRGGFTFNFILPLSTEQRINTLQDLYDTILDEGYDQDWKIYGSGAFFNRTYSGTSYIEELYIADGIAIDSNYSDQLMIYGVQCRQVWNYHCGFICNDSYWGCDNFEIQDEVY